MTNETISLNNLKRLKEHLRSTIIKVEHPKVHLDMRSWAYSTDYSRFGERVVSKHDFRLNGVCGTAACAAGHMCLMEGLDLTPPNAIKAKASHLLPGCNADFLFGLAWWPWSLKETYKRARTDKGRARVLLKVIDWFIKEQGLKEKEVKRQ